ncbi:MAG: hypothetical protein RR390_18765 [Hafnia sp.]
MSVKRYDLVGDMDGNCNLNEARMELSDDGVYVKYSEHLLLEQKLTDMAVQIANAESKCRELAAESSRVKLVASNLVSEYISNKGTDCEFISCITPSKNTIGTGGVWDMWRLLDLVLQETPATDAFLAEVRAQGVEMFADFCGEENSVFVEAKAYYRSLPGAVAEFAVKLRKGAAL